jgi:hypothetical protein
VLPRIDEEGDDGLFAKSFGGFQAVQTLNKHEARAGRYTTATIKAAMKS